MAYQAQMAQQQPQPVLPQPTAFGTNNPFAAFAPTPSPAPQQQPQQTGAVSPARVASPPAPVAAAPAPSTSPFRARPPKDDGQHAELARLLAAGREDGIDTFGNMGNLRVPMYVFLFDVIGLGLFTRADTCVCFPTQRFSVRDKDGQPVLAESANGRAKSAATTAVTAVSTVSTEQ